LSGPDEGDAQPAGDGRAPRRLGESLDRVVEGLGGNSTKAVSGSPTKGSSGLFSRWAELVGPDIAAHARPQRVHDGQLIVVTDDPAWASQLRWLASELVARIAEGDGPRLTGILVRVRPR
jgi:predicted nucleic acid-binding Zn ribbon protein